MSFQTTDMKTILHKKSEPTMEYLKGAMLSISSLFLLNGQGIKQMIEIVLTPFATALITFCISVLTLIWMIQKICETRLSNRLKRKELENGNL